MQNRNSFIVQYTVEFKKILKKRIYFSGYRFMERDLLVWSCNIDFIQIGHWAFGMGVPGLIIYEERMGKDRPTQDPTPLRKANESRSYFSFF